MFSYRLVYKKNKFVVETSALLASTWSLSDDQGSSMVLIHLPKAKRYCCLNASVRMHLYLWF
uniref:Uncharacterized protein n=1 Tax=Aegilops tauschii subsp. strangulata TaxID=200361 RepID=A0A453L2R3_AEGTS